MVDRLHIASCDCRRYSEQPQKYGVNVYQGAFTVYNFNGDARSSISASLTNISVGAKNAPVLGSGIFVSGFSDPGGWVQLDELTTGAGIAGQTAPVEESDPEQWEAVMRVDVIGTFHVTRLCIPHLRKSAAGSIIVMSSVGGRFGYPNRGAYCTAKMGLIGFAKTLSRELGQYNIRVNAIAPPRSTRRWKR